MNWLSIIPIIAQYGLPLAERLWQLATNNLTPTQADWDELKLLAAKTSKSQLIDALNRANIPLDSDWAKQLLSQV